MTHEQEAQRMQWAKEELLRLMEPHVKEAIRQMSLVNPVAEYVEGELKLVMTQTEKDILDRLTEVKQMYMGMLGIKELLTGQQ